MNNMQSLTSKVNELLSNEYVNTGTVVSLVLYSAIIAPNMPENLKALFSSQIFNLVIVSILAYLYTQNKAIALTGSIAFILSLQYLKKSNVAGAISEEVIRQEHPAEEVMQLVEEEIKRVISEEMRKPSEERISVEEVRQVAEERVENRIMEETRSSQEIIQPTEEGTGHSIVPESTQEQPTENEDVKNLVSEEMKRIISEEIKKPSGQRMEEEEVRQVAEERIENRIMEESRIPVEEIIPNDVTPMSRILVEEELKKAPQNITPSKYIPVPAENNQLAVISEEVKSPLQEQINNANGAEPTDVKTRSTRGLDINKKCNLCNVKPIKNNNNIEIKAFSGNSFAEF